MNLFIGQSAAKVESVQTFLWSTRQGSTTIPEGSTLVKVEKEANLKKV